MLIAAVARVPHQNGHFPVTLAIVRHRIERRVHPGWEVKQFAPHFGVRYGKKAQITAGGKYTADSLLRQATQRVKKLISQATGKFVQVCPPDMPVKLAGLNATTQQSQPQCGIELTVEKKSLLTVSFCFRDDRFRQRFFPREKLHRKRRTAIT